MPNTHTVRLPEELTARLAILARAARFRPGAEFRAPIQTHHVYPVACGKREEQGGDIKSGDLFRTATRTGLRDGCLTPSFDVTTIGLS